MNKAIRIDFTDPKVQNKMRELAMQDMHFSHIKRINRMTVELARKIVRESHYNNLNREE